MTVEANTAETHLEVYRPFRGQLRRHGVGLWPLITFGFRQGTKRRIPLLLLYSIPTIQAIVFSFMVYARYAVESGGMSENVPMLLKPLARQAMQNLAVRELVVSFLANAQPFAVLAMAWFGTGLIAEDLRAGAHQLWFARPLSRVSYVLGRFLTVASFGALAILAPGFLILLVATVNSPDYSFLRDEGDVVWRTLLYAGLWITVISLIALAVSSLVRKRAWAIVAFFAFVAIPTASGQILGDLVDRGWRAIAWLLDLIVLSQVLLGVEVERGLAPVHLAWWGVGVVSTIALGVIVWRIRRVEVLG